MECALRERTKELNALHGAARLLQQNQRPLRETLCEFANLLPPAWQYPDITSARITYEDAECATPGFAPAPWMQVAQFDGGRGRIEVAYGEERPAAAEGPFLAEERALLESLAEMCEIYVKRRGSEDFLRESERDLRAVNRALRALSAVNHVVMYADDEQALLDRICEIIVSDAGYRLAWVGYADEDEVKSVRPAAQAGFDDNYLAQARVSWADIGRGRGPVGTAIRTGKTVVIEDVRTDPRFAPWRAEAVRRGFVSCAAFPLRDDERAFGSLNIYAAEENSFHAEELRLLLELAGSLTHGIISLRNRLERARLAMAVEQAAESIVITDAAGAIQYVNPAFERTSGFTRTEALGCNPNIVRSGLQPPEFYEEMWRTIRGGKVWSGTFTNRRKDGSLFHEEATISPVRDASGTITNFVAVKRDVSRERELETQFLQAQKMEAVGRLAGGVAHDFNNLLAVILGYGEMVLESLPGDHPMRQGVTEITRAAERAAGLTRQLLAFSRQQVMQPRVINLNTVAGDLEKMLHRLIGENIQLTTRMDPALGRVKADPGQIEQVLMNLVVNARDAMPGGGKLIVETSNVALDEAYAECHHPIQPGPYVRLTVSDTGQGMDEETQKKIFEPFFTTKEKGKGTGLGLATVYGIIKQSGGFIWVYSEPGHGTTFKIYLPRVEQGAESEKQKEPFAGAPRGTETILLAEDSDSLRELNREILTGLGYTVLEARHGEEALRRFTEYDGPLHLLATDVVMPVMGGRELASRIAEIRPDMKILFMSGYTDEAIQLGIHWQPETMYLQKPFRPTELAQRIRRILDGNSEPPSRA